LDELEALAARLIARGASAGDAGLRTDLLMAGRTLTRMLNAGGAVLLLDEEAA
jgi:hypothetical protein